MSTTYRAAAEKLWGEAGAYVHEAYDKYRPLFPELPRTLPIVIGLTAYGKCIGLTRTDWEHGPRITIQSSAFKGGTDLVDDVMIHEMLHAWLAVTGRDPEHGSSDWYDAINRLSPTVLGRELGAKRGADRKSVRVKTDDGRSVVRKVRVEGVITHNQVANWPGPFLPRGRDRGRRLHCPTY